MIYVVRSLLWRIKASISIVILVALFAPTIAASQGVPIDLQPENAWHTRLSFNGTTMTFTAPWPGDSPQKAWQLLADQHNLVNSHFFGSDYVAQFSVDQNCEPKELRVTANGTLPDSGALALGSVNDGFCHIRVVGTPKPTCNRPDGCPVREHRLHVDAYRHCVYQVRATGRNLRS
jgi:hypothetical protein